MAPSRPGRWGVAGGLRSIALMYLGLGVACGSSDWTDVRPSQIDVQPARGGAPGGGGGATPVPGSGGAGGAIEIDAADPGTGGSDASVDVEPAPQDAPPTEVEPSPGSDASDDAGIELARGLVARWKLDEGGGGIGADSSGRGNNAVLAGATWVMPGHPDAKYANPAALSFDGNDSVMLGTIGMPRNNQPQTLALWLSYSSVPTANAAVCIALADAGGNTRLKLGWKSQRLAAFKGGASANLVNVAPPAPGWHHLAYTFDGTTHRLFVDGSPRTSSTVAPDNGPVTSARLGANFDGNEPYTGLIDEVRVYDRALGTTEIAALAAGLE